MAKKEWLQSGADRLTFGERLEDLIKKKGITSTQLANSVGIPQSAISEYINGKVDKTTGITKFRAPDCASIIAIADYFSISTDYLLGRTKTQTASPTAQAAIEYTGLSEANVNSLHYLVANVKETLVIEKVDNVVYNDGCAPILDCFNDLFDALVGDRKTAERIAEYYIRMRQEAGNLGEHESDVRYILAPKTVFPGTHSEKESNIIVEHSCVKIGHEIENKLKRKYMGYHLTGQDKE